MDLSEIEIRTERLLLRRFRADDLDPLAAMRALPEVARYLFWEPETREQVEPILERRIAATKLEKDDDWVVLAVERQEDGLLLGDVTIFVRSVDIGRSRWAGSSIPTRAAAATRPRRPEP
jgi:RimJ/RimL family protein N-acetyltransferase